MQALLSFDIWLYCSISSVSVSWLSGNGLLVAAVGSLVMEEEEGQLANASETCLFCLHRLNLVYTTTYRVQHSFVTMAVHVMSGGVCTLCSRKTTSKVFL